MSKKIKKIKKIINPSFEERVKSGWCLCGYTASMCIYCQASRDASNLRRKV